MTVSSFDMPKAYDFTAAEQRLYDWWESHGWFKPEAASPDGRIWHDVVGIVLWVTGFLFEWIGDWQLTRFKADRSNAGQVMDRGLWGWTRHPNYFGDFSVWWGLYLIALATGSAWWTIVGPILMSVLLIRVSGAALRERGMKKSRPGYEEYVRRTSGFFQRPPRG